MNNVNSQPPLNNLCAGVCAGEGWCPFLSVNYIQKALLSVKISVALPQTWPFPVDLALRNVSCLLESKGRIRGLL